MNLYIMRHGIAEDAAATDAARNLTEEGREELKKMAKALRQLKIQFTAVYASPFNRTIQTAQTLLSNLQPELKINSCAPLASGNDSRGLFEMLQKVPTSSKTLLIGHEPDLSRLISTLITGERSASIQMKKGSIAKVSLLTKPGPGEGTLEWLLTPKQLMSIAP